MIRTILVTGGCGFVGSAVVRHLLERTPHRVVVADLLTYAAMPEALDAVASDPRYRFERADVADRDRMQGILALYDVDAVIHLAAESHVDRSIDGPLAFLRTNALGTGALLEAARAWLDEATPLVRARFRFHHVSTDEVFGSLGAEGAFDEGSPYAPRSPYAASKAASDHMVRAWGHTFGLPVTISNCSNNYGPWQFPEKLVALMTVRAIDGKELPVYGRGDNIRDWIHVDDHAAGILSALERGDPGSTYLFGGGAERRNIEIVTAIADLVEARLGRLDNGLRRRDMIRFVADRPGHDHRYAIDGTATERALDWKPAMSFDEGLARTVDWYLANRAWWQEILRTGRYDGGRLGRARRVAEPVS